MPVAEALLTGLCSVLHMPDPPKSIIPHVKETIKNIYCLLPNSFKVYYKSRDICWYMLFNVAKSIMTILFTRNINIEFCFFSQGTRGYIVNLLIVLIVFHWTKPRN